MVVQLQRNADTGSNKPGKFILQLTAQAYSYARPTGFTASVCKPQIDRLSFTYDVIGKAKRQKLGFLLKALPQWKKQKGWGSGKYSNSYALDIGIDGKVLVQHSKLTSTNRFLRFEFSGSAISTGGFHSFRKLLPKITGGIVTYEDVAKVCNVTRVDVAVDLVNIDVEDLLINSSKPGVTMGYFGVDGKTETNYLNVTTKGSRLYVYDRRASQLKQKAKGKGNGPEYGDTKYTRVEIRLEPNRPISELSLLKHNPFKRIDLIDIEAPEPPEEGYNWKTFQDSCRYRGLAGALNHLPGDVRKQYEAAVLSNVGELWKPTLLWKLWPNTVEKSGLLSLD